MSVSLKQAVSVLKDVPSRFLTLQAFCEAAGISADPTTRQGAENLHKVRKAIAAMADGASDLFDLGAQLVPMLVPYRGSEAYGCAFERIEMPDDPTVNRRKAEGERKTAPQTNLMPAVRLVDKDQWDKYNSADAIRESLRTGVLKTLAGLPDNQRVFFGDVKTVAASPTEGWAMVTMLVKVG